MIGETQLRWKVGRRKSLVTDCAVCSNKREICRIVPEKLDGRARKGWERIEGMQYDARRGASGAVFYIPYRGRGVSEHHVYRLLLDNT